MTNLEAAVYFCENVENVELLEPQQEKGNETLSTNSEENDKTWPPQDREYIVGLFTDGFYPEEVKLMGTM